MNYDDFPLEDIIKLYASIVQDPELDVERYALHSALCKKLGVSPYEFRPLEDIPTNCPPAYAEKLIREAIRGLKQ